MTDEFQSLTRATILGDETFVRATFSGARWGAQSPWVKVAIRPVLLKEKRHLQFSYFDERQDTSKNFLGAEAAAKLDEILALPQAAIYLQTASLEFQIQFSKKGQALIRRSQSAQHAAPALAHDFQKSLLLPEGKADPYLTVTGIMTRDGRVKTNMRGKFWQVNEFLKLVQQTGELEKLDRSPISVVDCGCGNAYLSFALYHYLSHILGRSVQLTGIDVRVDLIEKQMERVRALGWQQIDFQAAPIADFAPAVAPDIVIALHACDTATDEALALGLRHGSRLMFAVPCCHHHLQAQLSERPAPSAFVPLARHGILSERLGDLLTDSFRALILRIMGYRTDVVEYVATEHTARNLMIRAARSSRPGEAEFVREYVELKQFWGVTPYLETLLGAALTDLIK